ncbi:MAG: hypothetical protein ACJARI_003379 [Bacteroidia bacterium]|jgi:hypothetical protein
MEMFQFSKCFFIALMILAASGCKLRINLPEGGYVLSASGKYDCQENHSHQDPETAHGGEEEQAHCEITITSPDFDETFIAVPNSGWEFKHWKKSKNSLHGNSQSAEAPLFTLGFETNEFLMSVLNSDEEFILEPVFAEVGVTPGETNCASFEGSYDRIQSIIFEGYNCTNSACHSGDNPAGELDLSASVSYDNLFRVQSAASLVDPMQRVFPGEQKDSFLYAKLAAGTFGTDLPVGGGQSMPLASAPLSTDHLEAMRLWIRNGAPETNDVDEVATLLGCGQGTAPQANKITPPDPPAVGEGVQFLSGPWPVFPESEKEVCFATYYDLEKTPKFLPESAKTPCEGGAYVDYDGSCMAINSSTLTQDPQSHHSIIDVYVGASSPLDPSWGSWQCLNGPSKGMTCDPTRIGEPVADGGADCGGGRFVCSTKPEKSLACRGMGPPDRRTRLVGMGGAQAPINSSALADGVYSVLPTRGVISWNSHAFNLSAKETTIEQYNNFLFAPVDERRYLSRSIFDSKDIFVATVPPYEKRTYCSTYTLPIGARLSQLGSHAHKRATLFQSWLPPQNVGCKVSSGCKPHNATPDYVSRIYNDPLEINYDPPLEYDMSNRSNRTIKFCVTYDNGKQIPELLKLNSTSVGTTCVGRAFCADGPTPGLSCGSDNSVCGDGGSCDACTVVGGVTTEDEMFILLGNYFILPLDERE